MSGDAASSILQQDRLIKVWVIFPADVRTSLDKVRSIQVRSSSGQLFRLDQVADIEYDKGQAEINRENLRQMVAVTGVLKEATLVRRLANSKSAR
jgi:Cu/Ag efflux pump CusA